MYLVVQYVDMHRYLYKGLINWLTISYVHLWSQVRFDKTERQTGMGNTFGTVASHDGHFV